MFEQELYSYEASALRTQPGDLFYHYEIKNWNFGPRLYKILALSAVANILVLVVIGSSGLLTARGCDSPFVGRVCQVLDTVYVGSVLFGTDSEYADVDYTKTELQPGDEITFIDTTGVEPPLTYPEGYFQIANPEQQFANMTDPMAGFDGQVIPGIPTNPTISGNGLLNTPPIAPPSNPNAVEGDLPSSPFGEPDDNPTIAGSRKGRRGGQLSTKDANTNPDPKAADSNSNTTPPTGTDTAEAAQADEHGVFKNKRPLKDKATETLAKVDAGNVALDKPFRVVITGTLGFAEDGKTVILKNPKVAPVDKNFPADPVLTKLAEEWVVAVGDSGWYGYLGVMDEKRGVGRKVTITLEQNDATFLASVRSEQPTPERANTAASGLSGLMQASAFGAKEDELTFLKSTKTSSEGKFLIVNFEMPKSQAQEMIQRKLTEFREKEAKPESNAFAKPNNNTAEK